MEPSNLPELGLGLIAALLIIREVFSFLSKKHNTRNYDSYHNHLDKIQNLCEKLYDMHNIRDADGTPLWYTKRSFSDKLAAIEKKLDDVLVELRRNRSQ